jgi:hypothetical protein
MNIFPGDHRHLKHNIGYRSCHVSWCCCSCPLAHNMCQNHQHHCHEAHHPTHCPHRHHYPLLTLHIGHCEAGQKVGLFHVGHWRWTHCCVVHITPNKWLTSNRAPSIKWVSTYVQFKVQPRISLPFSLVLRSPHGLLVCTPMFLQVEGHCLWTNVHSKPNSRLPSNSTTSLGSFHFNLILTFLQPWCS